MLQNRNVVLILCLVLLLALAILMFFEIRNPEGGVAFVKSIRGAAQVVTLRP